MRVYQFYKGGKIDMSLINCPECGKEISDSAKKCPKCGYPISKNKTQKIICIAALAVIMLLAVSGTYYLENRRDETEQEQVDNVITANSGKVTPSFKATMDSYEDFLTNMWHL
jgi:ribosomal protein L37E